MAGVQRQLPAGFTDRPRSYRIRAWAAMIGLIAFAIVYVALAGWFTYTTYRMVLGVFAGGDGAVACFFTGLPPLLISLFMWNAFFFSHAGNTDPGIEIKEHDEPRLFSFIYELADEIGAPRPYRVFLVGNVNASVFYDLSIVNLLFPSKKNLAIGLGLVNSLNRSEFRAVLAHEFGHFAQRSMAVGRWVCMGEQTAGHLISKHGFLDSILSFISRIDLRVAWIGWIMRSIVWSIRSLLETLFGWVTLAHRALSREMEFHADLVAVSVTGSDALIHALYRLQSADEHWQLGLNFANERLRDGELVTNLYQVQSRVGQHMGRMLDRPRGVVPEIPARDPANHRVFDDKISHPPQMWSTHPPNNEREENAKRVYVASVPDDHSAWSLFSSPEDRCTEMTRFLVDDEVREKATPLPGDLALQKLDQRYGREFLDPRYRGCYLGRSPMLAAETSDAVYSPPVDRETIGDELARLYGADLQEQTSKWRDFNDEIVQLEQIESQPNDSSLNKVHYHGTEISRQQLPELIRLVKQERDEVLSAIEDHDRRCRTVHRTAARYVGRGWDDYVVSLGKLLHYLEHSVANLGDAYGHLANTTQLVTASGTVGRAKVRRLIESCNDLHSVMMQLDRQRDKLVLPSNVSDKLGTNPWTAPAQKFDLPPADEQNIDQWIRVIDGWTETFSDDLVELRLAVLDELLATERDVADHYVSGEEAPVAPSPAEVPSTYATLIRGKERPLQKKLDWWSRFTTADGMVPSILRFAVASTVVFAAVTAGLFVGSATIYIHNGLARSVEVTVNDQTVLVSPGRHRKISTGMHRTAEIQARCSDDKRFIEAFSQPMEMGYATYVYNVAGASGMSEWTATYGNARGVPDRMLGFPRWRNTTAQHVFEQPPRSVKTKGGGAKRTVLSDFSDQSPLNALGTTDNQQEINRAIDAHARWDSPDSKYFFTWMDLAKQLDRYPDVLLQRLESDPREVATLRLQQDWARQHGDQDLLSEHRRLGDKFPDDPDMQYIAIRASDDDSSRSAEFLSAHQRWPHHPWLAHATGFAEADQGHWDAALGLCEPVAISKHPASVLASELVFRLRRLLSPTRPVPREDLQLRPAIQLVVELESDPQQFRGTGLFAQGLLYQGKLEEAAKAVSGQQGDWFRVLLGTSSGATDPMQRDALELPITDQMRADSLVYLAALAVRCDQPPGPYLENLSQRSDSEAKRWAELAQRLFEPGSEAELQPFFDDLIGEALTLRHRCVLMAAALIAFPDRAPASWTDQVNALLLPTERPYLVGPKR